MIKPELIRQARLDAGLTQTQAAKLIYKSMRTWQQWEAGERQMQADSWELFNLKTKQLEKQK